MKRLVSLAVDVAAVGIIAAVTTLPIIDLLDGAQALYRRRRVISNAVRGYPIAYRLKFVDGSMTFDATRHHAIVSYCEFTTRRWEGTKCTDQPPVLTYPTDSTQ